MYSGSARVYTDTVNSVQVDERALHDEDNQIKINKAWHDAWEKEKEQMKTELEKTKREE